MNVVKTTKRRVFFILLIVTIILPQVGCNKAREETTPERPVAIRVVKPQITTLLQKISYMGTIHSRREIRIISRVQGTLMELPAAEGAKVRKGDVIARIYSPELEATVERLKAENDYWSRRYEADQRLAAEKAIPSEQLAASKRAYLSSKAALAGAQANMDKAIEKAPFSGEILKWMADPGQPVMPGQPILLMGNNQTEVQTEVIEEDLKRGLTPGITSIIYKKDGTIVESTVREVAPQAAGTSRTFMVKVPIPASLQNTWRKGESVKVDFVLKAAPNAVAVPVEAIADRAGNPHIFLIRDSRAYLQPVKPGIQQGDLIQVDFPYNGQDLVAVTNLGSLKDSVVVFTVQTGEGQ